MNLKEIQDKLNSMLTGTGRKLVFWYDDDGSYEENIHDFELLSGTKLWCVAYTKNTLNRKQNSPVS